jgi:hypothetical protein
MYFYNSHVVIAFCTIVILYRRIRLTHAFFDGSHVLLSLTGEAYWLVFLLKEHIINSQCLTILKLILLTEMLLLPRRLPSSGTDANCSIQFTDTYSIINLRLASGLRDSPTI